MNLDPHHLVVCAVWCGVRRREWGYMKEEQGEALGKRRALREFEWSEEIEMIDRRKGVCGGTL